MTPTNHPPWFPLRSSPGSFHHSLLSTKVKPLAAVDTTTIGHGSHVSAKETQMGGVITSSQKGSELGLHSPCHFSEGIMFGVAKRQIHQNPGPTCGSPEPRATKYLRFYLGNLLRDGRSGGSRFMSWQSFASFARVLFSVGAAVAGCALATSGPMLEVPSVKLRHVEQKVFCMGLLREATTTRKFRLNGNSYPWSFAGL